MGSERRHWTCPACNRTFKIPIKAQPRMCPSCAKAAGDAELSSHSARRVEPEHHPVQQTMMNVERAVIVVPPAAPQFPTFEREPTQMRKLVRGRPAISRTAIALSAIAIAVVLCITAKLITDHPESSLVSGMGLALLALGIAFYFLPTIVAVSRAHHNAQAIAVVNIFLGWTFIGYVVALTWAFTAVQRFDEHGNVYVRHWQS